MSVDIFQSEDDFRAFVIDAYTREYHKFLQRKAGGKQVSLQFAQNKLALLSTPPKRGEPDFWGKLYLYCKTGKFEPYRLIQAVFRAVSPMSKAVGFPHQEIFSKTTQHAYDRLQPSNLACADSLKQQIERLQRTVDIVSMSSDSTHSQIEADAVSMVTANYTALFRCCVLERCGRDSSPWLVQAVQDYRLSQDAFDQTWGELIPARLKELGLKRRAS